ncbi:MAG: hypothetical protein SFV22_01440 [Saprospiraceae bacterium]|nr:hypothetical protein [Saprospiraceae bacterium]
MTDKIQTFIQKYREAFDNATPGAHGWPGLERMLERLPESDALEKQLMCDRILLDTAEPSLALWNNIENALNAASQEIDLESFIQKNRNAFDHSEPGDQVWEHITGALPRPKAKVIEINWHRSLMRIAASLALVIAGIGGGIWYERQGGANAGMAMSDVSGEYAELEQYYQRDITVKREKLATFTGSQPTEVVQDIEHLDKVMEELRRELANVPPGNREKVVRAMIENYKAKTAILQRVLERLEETQPGDNSKQSNGFKNI